MATMKQAEVSDFLDSLNGKFFVVDFIKRSDGTRRRMRATTNYQKHLKGGTLNYSPKDKGLLVVWSLDSAGFRSIPTNNVLEIHANGEIYTIEN